MDFVWWLLIIISFIISFIGIVMPVIPGVLMIWLGFIIYHFGIHPLTGWNFWITSIILTIIILLVDYLASSKWVRKYGGSKASAWAAIGGILLGPFIFGPIGVIIGPFVFVTITELIRGYKLKEAIRVGFASFLGLVGGAFIKGFLHLVMIGIFFFKIWL